jgi:hypothetical protein
VKTVVNSNREVEAAISPSAPRTELGSETGHTGGPVSWLAFAGGADVVERVPELMWPSSVTTYRMMLNDAQINSLILGSTLPIRSYQWYLEPNGARPEIIDRISTNYNLPVGANAQFNRRRGQRRFSFAKHLEDALRALVYGHMFFEQFGEVNGRPLVWNLRKLGIRSPLTLTEINVAEDRKSSEPPGQGPGSARRRDQHRASRRRSLR